MDDLYDDLEFTQSIELVKIDEETTASEYDNGDEIAFMRSLGLRMPRARCRRDFSLSPLGVEAATELWVALKPEDAEAVESIKRRFNKMPFFDLLRYVYNKYPKFAEKSVLTI
jgi:hypothetical protein